MMGDEENANRKGKVERPAGTRTVDRKTQTEHWNKDQKEKRRGKKEL
jgi:hypothetical protein